VFSSNNNYNMQVMESSWSIELSGWPIDGMLLCVLFECYISVLIFQSNEVGGAYHTELEGLKKGNSDCGKRFFCW
jgi:hypothetical protein